MKQEKGVCFVINLVDGRLGRALERRSFKNFLLDLAFFRPPMAEEDVEVRRGRARDLRERLEQLKVPTALDDAREGLWVQAAAHLARAAVYAERVPEARRWWSRLMALEKVLGGEYAGLLAVARGELFQALNEARRSEECYRTLAAESQAAALAFDSAALEKRRLNVLDDLREEEFRLEEALLVEGRNAQWRERLAALLEAEVQDER